ncbi:MFS transporter [Erythrobacter sp. NFXS35]|uniref:MFS transporter n=1 Tax=Erythrobacter sp. NFXS35 TaxID=2818436 RepID=UPI0032E017D3
MLDPIVMYDRFALRREGSVADVRHQLLRKELILSESKFLRLTAVALFYFTQGIPQGLFYFALPAWLAATGASAAAIASVVAAAALPHTLKFATGFILDRYTYLPMGRRRAWIIGAQLALTGTFVIGAIISPDSGNIAILSAVAFASSLSYSFQDVGIDSLAIDLMEDDERAKAAGLMFGSATVGISLMTWSGGLLLESFGSAAAFAVAAFGTSVALVFGITVRERPGEKRVPWSAGSAHPRNEAIQVEAWWPLLRDAFRVLLAPVSLVFVVILVARGIPAGLTETLHPLIAIRDAGWQMSSFTNLVSIAQLTAAFAALFVFGWIVDLISPQRALIAGAILYIILFAGITIARPLWGNSALLIVYILSYDLVTLFFTVALIALAMRICTPAVAAAQFSVYMAAGNMGRPIGAALMGSIGEENAIKGFMILAALFLLALIIALVRRFPNNRSEQNLGSEEK